jgi:hypothetical protein
MIFEPGDKVVVTTDEKLWSEAWGQRNVTNDDRRSHLGRRAKVAPSNWSHDDRKGYTGIIYDDEPWQSGQVRHFPSATLEIVEFGRGTCPKCETRRRLPNDYLCGGCRYG